MLPMSNDLYQLDWCIVRPQDGEVGVSVGYIIKGKQQLFVCSYKSGTSYLFNLKL